ncbi:MAG: alkaline phytoceramidase [Gammaproteobacteria bacterium]|nr:alkaline phytoceramidase [Gammaproteobacteria bacterium]
MNKKQFFLVAGILVLITLLLFFVPPIAQDLSYHNFADQRTLLGIPHFWNIISNVPLLIIGLTGLLLFVKHRSLAVVNSLRSVYQSFFIGICLVCLGSSYYHLAPGNTTLVWDRLPMTIAFMSFFCVVVAEYSSERAGKLLFIPLLCIGLLSVLYWYFTEIYFVGDLRFYALVQFLPILLLPLIMFTGHARFSHGYYYWLILATYILAKLLEHYDAAVYEWLGFISGHSLKHIASSFASYFLYRAIKIRQATL